MSRINRLVVLAPVVAALCAIASPAQARTVISPPTITAPPGPYPVGKPVTFTFTETGAGTPVAYKYQLNGGPAKKVKAPTAVAQVQITPTRQTSFLTAYAVAADGTVSGGTLDIFQAFSTHPAADKDLNGDGRPDLVTVGGTRGLAPGLWLATGARARRAASAGRVRVPATDIGINGWSNVPGKPTDFNGTQVITGLFTADGFQDVIVYNPTGFDAGGGAVLAGSGDGSALQSQISPNATAISAGTLTDGNGDNPMQLANAYSSITNSGLPDLIAPIGDPTHGYYLRYYTAFAPGAYFVSLAIHVSTPDGTADWNKWRLATLHGAGGTGMFLWKQRTGALYLWRGVTVKDNGDGTGTITFTQYKIASHWNRGQRLATLEAADFDHDGVPDLWAVTPAGFVTAYQISHLSARSVATITAGKRQRLT